MQILLTNYVIQFEGALIEFTEGLTAAALACVRLSEELTWVDYFHTISGGFLELTCLELGFIALLINRILRILCLPACLVIQNTEGL